MTNIVKTTESIKDTKPFDITNLKTFNLSSV